MKKLLTAVILFLALTPGTAHSSQLFNLFFDEGGFPFQTGFDFVGTYVVENGVASNFHVTVLGNPLIKWTFDLWGGDDPFDGLNSDTVISTGIFPDPFRPGLGAIQGLHLFENVGPGGIQHEWRIHTLVGHDRSGLYTAQAVPEASAWLLVGIGLIALATIRNCGIKSA